MICKKEGDPVKVASRTQLQIMISKKEPNARKVLGFLFLFHSPVMGTVVNIQNPLFNYNIIIKLSDFLSQAIIAI